MHEPLKIVKRLNYFEHQFLHADDFNDEQAYQIARRRLHNRYLHCPGVAFGLGLETADGQRVTVSPGFAIDRLGQEIVVPKAIDVPLLEHPTGTRYIVATYAEQLTDKTSSTGAEGDTRWIEEPKLECVAALPSADTASIVLGSIDVDGKPGSEGRQTAGDVTFTNVDVRSQLTVEGGPVQFAGSLKVGRGLIVEGAAAFGGALSARKGPLTINGATVLTDGLKVGKNLTVSGDTTIAGTLSAGTASLTIGGPADVAGALSAKSIQLTDGSLSLSSARIDSAQGGDLTIAAKAVTLRPDERVTITRATAEAGAPALVVRGLTYVDTIRFLQSGGGDQDGATNGLTVRCGADNKLTIDGDLIVTGTLTCDKVVKH